jgi:hypothetical protein
MRVLDLDSDIDLVELVLHRWRGARQPIAALSHAVGDAARMGDPCAHRILADAADELVGLVETTRLRLGFEPEEVVPVSHSGGVFAMPEVVQGFAQGIGAIDARYRVSTPMYSPVVGGALYAATLAGTPLGESARQRLRSAGG